MNCLDVNFGYTTHAIQNLLAGLALEVRSILPSPFSEFLLGITLGLDEINLIPTFNDVVASSGTLHVIVVSGFNINLVLNFIFGLLGSKYRFINVITAQIFAVIYAVITGFKPPVARALLMGSCIIWTKYFGYKNHVIKVLFLTALIMTIYEPCILNSLSFQFSFLATLGLIVLSERISNFVTKYIKLTGILVEDFSATLSAQIFLFPLLFFHFGEFNLKSIFANTFSLWLIPPATTLGIIAILILYINFYFGAIFLYLILPLLYLYTLIIKIWI